MKHIFLNLKRFDVPRAYGGVNSIALPSEWGSCIVKETQEALREYAGRVEFAMYFPEAHVPGAAASLSADSPIKLGCQSVYREDTAPGGNFGAFTGERPANAMKALGVSSVLIGHCEERKAMKGILAEAGVTGKDAAAAVNRILNKEIACALRAGMSVLYCVGESAEEQPQWQDVLQEQIETGLSGYLHLPDGRTADGQEAAGEKEQEDAETGKIQTKPQTDICIAYEPIWAIGPGKTPPDRDYISKIGAYLKKITGGLPIVYGGGLKTDNAAMLASIPEIDGGLIALTRFSGEIGFYPDEYLEIVRTYLEAC